MFRLLTDSMVFKDDPDHQRLRGLVNQVFAPRMVAGLQSLLKRFGKIELTVPAGELRYKPSESLRGLRSLPLRLRYPGRPGRSRQGRS